MKLTALLGIAAMLTLAGVLSCGGDDGGTTPGVTDKCKDVTCDKGNTCDKEDGKCKCGNAPECKGENKKCIDGACKLDPGIFTCSSTKGETDLVWLVDALELAPTDQGCDYTGDGLPDNAVATILDAFKSELGDQDPNQMIADELAKGTVLVLMETLGLKDFDKTCFDMNMYQGLDKDCFADPANLGEDGKPTSECREANAADNFSGTEELCIDPASYGENDKPLITYSKVKIVNGELEAGPSTFKFVIPVQEEVYNVELQEVYITATASATELKDGMICGYILNQAIIDIVCNLEAAAQYCDTVTNMLPSVADIDLNDDGNYEAFSIAALFGTTTGAMATDGCGE